MEQQSLKEKTQKALLWSLIDRVGQQLIYFVSGVILARQLTSDDYGKVGLLMLFIAISNILIDSGFGSALIRKKEATEADYNTVFYFNLLVSILFYALLFAAAPLIARYFNTPDLVALSRVLFLAIPAYSLGLIQNTLLLKKIEFTTLAKVNFSSLFLTSALSITLAYTGFGVWALVGQTVGTALFRSVMLWCLGSWRCRPIFRLDSLREFFGYSSNLIGSGLLNATFNNILPLIIGKNYSRTDVGYYTQAYKFQDIPSAFISNWFRSVGFPVLSSIHDDPVRLKQVYKKYMRAIAYCIFPMMALFAAVATPFFELLLTAKWLPSVPLLRILAVGGAFAPFIILSYDLLNAIGRSDLNLRMEVVKKVGMTLLLLLLYRSGIESLVWLWAAYTLLSLLWTLYFTQRECHYGYRDFVSDTLPALLLSLLLGGGAYLLTQQLENLLLAFALPSLLFGIAYLLCTKWFKFEIYGELMQLLHKKIIQKRNA